MAYYPPGLPDPLNGSAFTTKETRITTEGELSPRTRITDPNYQQTLSLSWSMTEEQFRVFESWHRHRLHDGISCFDTQWNCQDGRARFTGPVQASLNGANWQLSGEVEIDYA